MTPTVRGTIIFVFLNRDYVSSYLRVKNDENSLYLAHNFVITTSNNTFFSHLYYTYLFMYIFILRLFSNSNFCLIFILTKVQTHIPQTAESGTYYLHQHFYGTTNSLSSTSLNFPNPLQ